MANERFEKNLEKWAPFNHESAERLKTLQCKEVFLCRNQNGELNLKLIFDQKTHYLHSESSAFREAQLWFLSLDLKNIETVYVYGIGLGYYYDVVQSWLKENPRRHVIFLEDNLEVLKLFLETERASDLLNNKQVRLFHFNWDTSFFSFQFVTSLFSLLPYKVTALKFYEENQAAHMREFRVRLDFFHELRSGTASEFFGLSPYGFMANYYKNLLELPRSKLELKLAGHFKNIPAIICGAGPSLGKNIHILKTLQDKALIMAGGTAMNVLNGAGIMPHFGLGIDPNPSHYSRLISNTAFETPFFYRQRMFSPALKMIHGERIFVTGAGGYRLPSWFEERLEIPKVPDLEEGHNIVNFNLSIAKDLGCNPILVVGVDLAYSDNLSYAPGLVRHAIQDPKEAFLTKYSHEELLIKNDINGVPVNTLWKWVNESLWYAQFASKNPDVTLLNCTEGGIGFPHVPNVKLSEAAKQFLTKTYDFSSLLHGEIQNSNPPESLTLHKVIKTMEDLTKSLLHSESYSATVAFEFGKLSEEMKEKEEIAEIYHTPILEEYLAKLEGEDGYKFLLQDYKERYLELFYPKHHYLESDPAFNTPKEIRMKRIAFDIGLYAFLAKVARHNITLLGQIFTDFANQGKLPANPPSKKNLTLREKLIHERQKNEKKETYSFENEELKIIDPELSLNYVQACKCEVKKTYYPEGALKSKHTLYKGKFHGPSAFYAENGQILSLNWFINGQLEGKSWFYYPSGELYALKRHKKNLLNGRQEFFYRNGLLKSALNFKSGHIDGEFVLFYENGKVKREMVFKNGKRNGPERMWNEEGMLILEAHYRNDQPIGMAKEWYSNGVLAKEISYEANSENYDIKQWKEDGTPLAWENMPGKNYFDLVSNYSKSLNVSLQNIYQTLVNIAPNLPETKKNTLETSVEDDLIALKNEMEKLNKYNQQILTIGGYQGKNIKEAVWKTPETEKMLRAQLDKYSQELTKIASATQENLQILFQKMEKLNSPPTENDNKQKPSS